MYQRLFSFFLVICLIGNQYPSAIASERGSLSESYASTCESQALTAVAAWVRHPLGTSTVPSQLRRQSLSLIPGLEWYEKKVAPIWESLLVGWSVYALTHPALVEILPRLDIHLLSISEMFVASAVIAVVGAVPAVAVYQVLHHLIYHLLKAGFPKAMEERGPPRLGWTPAKVHGAAVALASLFTPPITVLVEQPLTITTFSILFSALYTMVHLVVHFEHSHYHTPQERMSFLPLSSQEGERDIIRQRHNALHASLAKHPDDLEALQDLAGLYVSQHLVPQAEVVLARAMALSPEDPRNHQLREDIELEKGYQLHAASVTKESSLRLERESPPVLLPAQWEEAALAALNRIRETRREITVLQTRLAKFYLEQGRFDESIRTLKQAKDLIRFIRGLTRLLPDAKQSEMLDQDESFIRAGLKAVYSRTGRYDLAMATLSRDRGESLLPVLRRQDMKEGRPTFHISLAVLLRGSFEEVRKKIDLLQQAVRLFPAHREVGRMLGQALQRARERRISLKSPKPLSLTLLQGGRPGHVQTDLEPVALADVLTQRPLRASAGRLETHEQGLWHQTVHVYLVTPDGRLLLQLRSRSLRVSPGKVQASISGHVDAADVAEVQDLQGLAWAQRAAQREGEEEMGLLMDPERLIALSAPNEVMRNELSNREFTTVFAYALTENEMRQVQANYDLNEVEALVVMDPNTLAKTIRAHPEAFSGSLQVLLERYPAIFDQLVHFRDGQKLKPNGVAPPAPAAMSRLNAAA